MTYPPLPPILRNLYNFPPGAFYLTPPTPLQLDTKEKLFIVQKEKSVNSDE